MYGMNEFGGLPSFGGFDPNAMGGGVVDPRKKKKGMNPLMMLSPLLGMFASGHPNIGLGMISPGLGIGRALGAFD